MIEKLPEINVSSAFSITPLDYLSSLSQTTVYRNNILALNSGRSKQQEVVCNVWITPLDLYRVDKTTNSNEKVQRTLRRKFVGRRKEMCEQWEQREQSHCHNKRPQCNLHL